MNKFLKERKYPKGNFVLIKFYRKKYLNHLLEQLSKSLANTEKESKHLLKESRPEELVGEDYNPSVIPFFTLVYATQSNTSKKFSEWIMHEATTTLGLKCQIKNISELNAEDFKKNIYLVFLLATYGEGGPTDDCIEFYSKLKSGILDEVVDENKYLCYSMFGLGSSKYENFNAISKTFEKTFQSNRIQRVCDYGEGDDAKNINEDFEKWKKKFWKQSYSYFKENMERYNAGIEILQLKKLYEGVKEEIQVSLINKNEKENSDSLNDEIHPLIIEDYDFGLKRFLQSEEYQIKDIKELRKENINGSTLKVTYYSHDKHFKYSSADNIGIYPVNNESSVNAILNRLNYDPNQIVCVKKFKKGDLQKKVSIPDGMTIREILVNILDLSCLINKDLIEKLLKFCYDEDQYESLQNIIKKETKYNEYLKKNYNIVDFVKFYDSINIPFLEFYRIMPKITPRFYTVASSSNYNKNKLEIIISLVDWKGVNGDTRYGVTSNYYKGIFDNFKLGDKENKNFFTKIIIRESSFRLPKRLNAPMIMIATGTGIAPYISFCQEFDHLCTNKNGEILNNTVLIFGSKNKQYDFIYEEEINSYITKSIIKKIYTAFSRDNQQKYYVQDVISESKSELEHLLLNEESIIYICGGVSMGAEVVSTLEKILTKEYVKKMESENRLIKELWG